MSNTPEQLTPIKRALLAIEELQARLDAVERARTEPVAIVGMACRFPGGAHAPQAYWHLLRQGVDAISQVPPERWDAEALYDPEPGTPGRISSRWGGFVQGVERFDAAFFGISPREAQSLDPQQRLLLEVAWEALESAGLPAERLEGSRTGVFAGMGNSDYGVLQALAGQVGPYTGTGTNLSVAAGRLAYTLGLQGPVLATDAGCASSLVAVHLACQSLRNGESDLALAAGVNVLASPVSSLAISQLRALAADGRCKVFDAAADGYVRSEGCGVVVLKRLSRALEDGDPVLAVLRGSAVNHGGRSTGLTAPNVKAQEAVLRAALASAGVRPEQVGMVETHGTGTSLGDPIEFQALANVFGPGRAASRPLVLGAVKSNLGHLETAAGMAGLLKAVLCLRHGEVPPNLHLRTPNPHLALDSLPVVLPRQVVPWPIEQGPRVAGVSAFGVGGTNAHVVLEEAPRAAAVSRPARRAVRLLPLSARSPEALRALAQAWSEHARGLGEENLEEACYTAAVRRSHHEHRLAVAFRTREELGERLEAYARGERRPGLVAGTRHGGGWQGLVLVFPGQGSQWVGMGRRLLEAEPVFRQALERCEAALQPYVSGWSVLGQLSGSEASRLEELAVVQPTLFALQVALAALWRSWGVVPDAVVGHSMGEVAAACVAGVLSLEDAARIIALRSRLLARVSGQGAMLMVELSQQQAQEALRGLEERASVAVSNGPRSTVLAGEPQALKEVAARLEAQGLFCRFVKVDVASHSPQVDPLLPELRTLLAGVSPGKGSVPLCSTVTGELESGEGLGAEYWVRNLRQPVRFAEAVERLAQGGYGLFVEVSPHPVLLPAVRQGLEHLGRGGEALPSLRREEEEQAVLLESLGALYVAGHPVDWRRLYPAGRCVPLPAYPWQHQRYWVEGAPQALRPAASGGKDEGLYQVAWHEQARPAEESRGVAPGRWLVLSERDGMGPALAWQLEARGARVVLARPGERYGALGPGRYEVRPEHPEDLEQLVRELGSEDLSGVVHLVGLDAPRLEESSVEALERAQQQGCGSVAALVRALLARGGVPPRVWLVTRGAQAVQPGEQVSPAQAPLWGLGRALAAEHPELWGGLVDLDPAVDVAEAGAELAAELWSTGGEDQVALRAGGRRVARLVPGALSTFAQAPWSVRAEGLYLITGGLGGIGLRVARWLADQGARHLVLLGRTPLPPRERWAELSAESWEGRTCAALSALESQGVRVEVASVDVGDEPSLRAFLQGLRASGVPVRGVMHAAGISELRPLEELDARSLSRVQRAKVAGGLLLDRLLEGEPLDFFVLFSSGSALLGSPLLSGYASANAFLDALAHQRRARGRPALSINWGFWAEVGIAAQRGAEVGRGYTPRGMEEIPVRQGLALLGALMGRQVVQVAVLPTRWEEWRAAYPAASRAPLFTELLGAERAPAPQGPEQAPRSRRTLSPQELRAAAPEERSALLAEHLRGLVTEVLRLSPSTPLAEDEPLNHVGIDSLMAIELKGRLQRELGVVLPAAVLLQGPTLAELGTRVRELLVAEELVAAVRSEGAPQAEDSDWESVTI